MIPADKAVEAKVEQVLRGMTLEEKAGQMVQLSIMVLQDETNEALDPAKLDKIIGQYKVGSILNVMNDHAHSREHTAQMVKDIQDKSMEAIGIPCIYGLDMIHGASYLTDGSFYPQEINLAATFNRTYARMMGHAMAYETRAAQVPWVFSPVMDLGRDPRWPRIWESFGEDAYLQAEMAREETLALQGEDPNHIGLDNVAVSIKHFMGYGVPASGKDRTPAIIEVLRSLPGVLPRRRPHHHGQLRFHQRHSHPRQLRTSDRLGEGRTGLGRYGGNGLGRYRQPLYP